MLTARLLYRLPNAATLSRNCCRVFCIDNSEASFSVNRGVQKTWPSAELSNTYCRPYSTNQDHSTRNESNRYKSVIYGVTATALGLGVGVYWKLKNSTLSAATLSIPGTLRSDLPTFTREDVSKHKTKGDKIWVYYKNGVYDITDYVTQHPGGSKILMAAGGSLEPFWELYAVHKHTDILQIVETFRIGNIIEVKSELKDKNDPYANEPNRNPILIPSSAKPFNAEPPPPLLTEKSCTPNDIFFVRNHLPVPVVDLKTYELEIRIEDKKKLKLNIDKLKKKFPKVYTESVVQCAGNRRSEMTKIKAVKGLNWNNAAISNAQWAGATLNDVLIASGINLDKCSHKHIVFEGMDKGPEGSPYGASLPIELARQHKNDILLAYEMNGTDIPRDHGYPVRVIMPGIVGARQVKWLNKIYLSNEESVCHWQRRDYKGFNSSIDWHNVDFDKSTAIQQLPVTSAICEPSDGTELHSGADDVTVKGYAWSGGGRGIVRVDVSVDGGKTWTTADLHPTNQNIYKTWAWTLWEVTVPLPANHKGPTQIVCKAIDVSYNVQPDSVDGIWNLRGCLSNAWHRVNVTIAKA